MQLCFYLLCLFLGLAFLERSGSECGAYPTQPQAQSTLGSWDMTWVRGTYTTELQYFSLSPQMLKVKTSAFLFLIREQASQTPQLYFPDS